MAGEHTAVDTKYWS